MASNLDRILKERGPNEEETSGNKFYQQLTGNLEESFLEFRLKNGMFICFPYHDISNFNYDPDGLIAIEFSGVSVGIFGRGLQPLYVAIKGKKASWIKEADSKMEDHKDNDCYVEEIVFEKSDGNQGDEKSDEKK